MSTRAFSRLAMPAILGLQSYAPGKPLDELAREYGVTDAIKLASNENPLGPSPRALEAVREELRDIALYPDGSGHALKAKLADRLRIGAERITLGNGSNDVLELLARAFAGPGIEVVFSQYAFAVYPIVTQAVGAQAVVTAAADFSHDLAAMRAAVTERTRLVFIANPNNPTGTWLPAQALEHFVADLPGQVLVVVDEAYFEYVEAPDYPDATRWVERYPNLVVTRTFSKAYGLAGLRVGYAISHPEVAELLNRVRQPFNVNSLGQIAALAALDDDEHVRRSRAHNLDGMRQLGADLVQLGLSCIPSVANFLCVDLGRPAAPVYEALLRAGVIVRPLGGYGLPQHLRITVGLEAENSRLVSALRKVLA
jgi:histidinol-phosphate aminotransferase